MTIILASASPRRMELLSQVGCEFTVQASDYREENSLELPPAEMAVRHARAKALDVAAKSSMDDVIIGADTIVVFQNRIFGKPKGLKEARRMLLELSGQEHHVITGVAVVRGSMVFTDFAVTVVHMRPCSVEELDRYLATGEYHDKAGAYAIQGYGALLIDSISGCYSNVVGLPLTTLAKLLQKAGVTLL